MTKGKGTVLLRETYKFMNTGEFKCSAVMEFGETLNSKNLTFNAASFTKLMVKKTKLGLRKRRLPYRNGRREKQDGALRF